MGLLDKKILWSDSGRRVVVGLALIALLGTPLLLVFWELAAQDSVDSLTEPAQPLLVGVEPVEILDQQTIQLALSWGEPKAITAPPWDGLVTEIFIKPGEPLHDLDPVLRIDNINRLAVHSANPFYRVLRRSDSGSDVHALQDALVRLGHLNEGGTDGVFGETTFVAVRKLAGELGVVGAVETFDPAWFLWLSESPQPIDLIHSKIGEPAPAAGEIVAEQNTQIVEARLLDSTGMPLELDGSVKWDVVVAASPLKVDTSEGTVVTAELETLSGLADVHAETIPATLQRNTVQAGWAVPVSAISLDEQGRSCVWVENEDGAASLEAVTVSVVDSTSGSSLVTGELQRGDKVLANPDQLGHHQPCS